MNEETYQDLKYIIFHPKIEKLAEKDSVLKKSIKKVEGWIDEVAKDYENTCPMCGEALNDRGEHKEICKELLSIVRNRK